MTPRRFAPLLVASVAIFSLTAAARAAEPEGVEAVDAAWKKAMLANDVDGIVACYADDAILWVPNHDQVTGKAAIRELFTGMLADVKVTEVTVTNAKYTTVGDKSVGWATFAITLTPKTGGDPTVIRGRYTEIAEKRGGKWVYTVDHASADPKE